MYADAVTDAQASVRTGAGHWPQQTCDSGSATDNRTMNKRDTKNCVVCQMRVGIEHFDHPEVDNVCIRCDTKGKRTTRRS